MEGNTGYKGVGDIVGGNKGIQVVGGGEYGI